MFPADIISAVTPEECTELARLANGKLVLELGSDYGRSTIALADAASVVFAIDWHRGDGHAGQRDTSTEFMRNITRYNVRHKIVAVIGEASIALPRLARGVFDMAFLDGFHEYETVARDIDLMWPLLKHGGVFAFHDYTVPHFGVKRAVDEFADSMGEALIDLPAHSLAVVHV